MPICFIIAHKIIIGYGGAKLKEEYILGTKQGRHYHEFMIHFTLNDDKPDDYRICRGEFWQISRFIESPIFTILMKWWCFENRVYDRVSKTKVFNDYVKRKIAKLEKQGKIKE
jgi:hypothetical protein